MSKLEKLIPLPQAAVRLGLSVEALTTLIDGGIVKANVTNEGEVLVPEREVKQTVTHKQFEKLRGVPITMMQAVKKYGVPYRTLIGWVHGPLNLIAIIKPGYGMQLDEADVARCVSIYRLRGKSSRIFDAAGRPYQIKRPELKEYRERRAKQERRASA